MERRGVERSTENLPSGEPRGVAHRRARTLLAMAVLLAMHSGLLAWSASRDSPLWDEVGHLVAGLSHWQFGTFALYRVNPPLVRTVAALPVFLVTPETDWSGYDSSVGARSERSVRQAFVAANGERILGMHTSGAGACIPFSLLGATVCLAGRATCMVMSRGSLQPRCGASIQTSLDTGTRSHQTWALRLGGRRQATRSGDG